MVSDNWERHNSIRYVIYQDKGLYVKKVMVIIIFILL